MGSSLWLHNPVVQKPLEVVCGNTWEKFGCASKKILKCRKCLIDRSSKDQLLADIWNAELKAGMQSRKWLSRMSEDLSWDVQHTCSERLHTMVHACHSSIWTHGLPAKESCKQRAVSTGEGPRGLPTEACTVLPRAPVLDMKVQSLLFMFLLFLFMSCIGKWAWMWRSEDSF